VGILGPVKVVVHDRTGELPAQLRAYAERKLERLSRHFDRVVEAEVEFDRERRKSQEPAHTVQVIVRTDGRRHPLAQAAEQAGQPRAAFDLAIDKLDRQVVKLKEKIKGERKKAAQEASVQQTALTVEAVAAPAPERIRVRLRPETLEVAERELDAAGHRFRVYLDEDTGEVAVLYRRQDGSIAVIEPVVG
jgi:ribosome hibernation promoting factor